MRFVIVTGMSGAGKSTALRMLEDAGYFCIDNLPISLLTKFGELCAVPDSEINKVALGLDIRSGSSLKKLPDELLTLTQFGIQYEILFLDCSDEVLIKRYKETRRSHPLAPQGRVDSGIALERQHLAKLKLQADYIIETSRMLTRELKKEIETIFLLNQEFKSLFVTVLSFGFKYGIPADCDLVFDVRFLPNPYYVEYLKLLTGNQQEVQDYVMQSEQAQIFLQKLTDMIAFLIPNYVSEGKNQLVIGIGCTGGKHRSVTLANKLFEFLEQKADYGLKIEHRDVER